MKNFDKKSIKSIITLLVIMLLTSGNPVLMVLAALFLLYELLSYLTVKGVNAGLTLTLDVPETAKKDEAVPIRIKSRKNGKLAIAKCDVELAMENLLTGEVTEMPVRFAVNPVGGSSAGLELTESGCGTIEIKPKSAEVSDPLGRQKRTVETISPKRVLIMPGITELELPDDSLALYNMESYTYSQSRPGSDPSETFGIDEYKGAGSGKAIHWKLTAKTGEVMVRIPSKPEDRKVLVVLDNALPANLALLPVKKCALAEFFLSVSFTLLRKGMEHDIAWASSGNFMTKHIANENDLMEAVWEVTSCPITAQDKSTETLLKECTPEEGHTSVFFVTAGSDPDLDSIRGRVSVKVFKV